MRCFIAVDLEKDIAEKVKEIQHKIAKLNVDVKFVEPENLHITLNFLGEVNENELEEIKKPLVQCLKDFHVFKIRISGLGFFGSPNYIRTLWFGLCEGENEFVKLMKSVNECVNIGKSSKKAHLTIGRVRSGKNRELLANFINKLKDVNVGEMYVKNVKLKKSVLMKKGPIYSDLVVFKLGGNINE